MKYIVFRKVTGSFQQEIPIIFPNSLVHLEVAQALSKIVGTSKVVAAGEFSSLDIEPNVSGRSSSIGIGSRGKIDERLIVGNDYNHGAL